VAGCVVISCAFFDLGAVKMDWSFGSVVADNALQLWGLILYFLLLGGCRIVMIIGDSLRCFYVFYSDHWYFIASGNLHVPCP